MWRGFNALMSEISDRGPIPIHEATDEKIGQSTLDNLVIK
jgi:hypothetical protein